MASPGSSTSRYSQPRGSANPSSKSAVATAMIDPGSPVGGGVQGSSCRGGCHCRVAILGGDKLSTSLGEDRFAVNLTKTHLAPAAIASPTAIATRIGVADLMTDLLCRPESLEPDCATCEERPRHADRSALVSCPVSPTPVHVAARRPGKIFHDIDNDRQVVFNAKKTRCL